MFKYFLSLVIVSITFCANAQDPTTAETKAKKIKSKTVTYGSGSDATKMVYYYDAAGYDTAYYYNGVRSSYKTIEYNTKGKPAKINIYNDDGTLKETSIYTYHTDGSSSAVNKDTRFGMSYNYKYDKNGNMLEFITPDGVTRKYTYDVKGRLIKTQCISEDVSERYIRTYTYNPKGQMLSSTTKGETTTKSYYEYGSNGLISKVKSTPTGKASVTYEYNF